MSHTVRITFAPLRRSSINRTEANVLYSLDARDVSFGVFVDPFKEPDMVINSNHTSREPKFRHNGMSLGSMMDSHVQVFTPEDLFYDGRPYGTFDGWEPAPWVWAPWLCFAGSSGNAF